MPCSSRMSFTSKGCWRDNVFIERFWRSLKYEEVYLHAYESASAAKAGRGVHSERVFDCWSSTPGALEAMHETRSSTTSQLAFQILRDLLRSTMLFLRRSNAFAFGAMIMRRDTARRGRPMKLLRSNLNHPKP